jgi:hypothetical protein
MAAGEWMDDCERRDANGVERAWRQCPILLIARALGLVSLPEESNASERVRNAAKR